jgi:hypothetical protein
LGEGFQKYFLRGLFNQTALAEEAAGGPKDAGAVAAHNLGEGGFIARAGELDELLIRQLFVLFRQRRSPLIEAGRAGRSAFRARPAREVRLLGGRRVPP